MFRPPPQIVWRWEGGIYQRRILATRLVGRFRNSGTLRRRRRAGFRARGVPNGIADSRSDQSTSYLDGEFDV